MRQWSTMNKSCILFENNSHHKVLPVCIPVYSFILQYSPFFLNLIHAFFVDITIIIIFVCFVYVFVLLYCHWNKLEQIGQYQYVYVCTANLMRECFRMLANNILRRENNKAPEHTRRTKTKTRSTTHIYTLYDENLVSVHICIR